MKNQALFVLLKIKKKIFGCPKPLLFETMDPNQGPLQ